MVGARPSLSVIVPVYNEEQEIGAIVPAVAEVLKARGDGWEIIVVDNASTDATVTRLQPFLGDSRVSLLRNEGNRGKGYSVRRGMLAATGDLRLMCDADCSPSLQSLPKMEAMLAEADVVAGARNASDSRVARYQPIHRRAASLGFIFLCRRLMSEPLRDVFCGFKLFTADAAVDVFSRSRIDGWAFDAEALALARALGYRVRGCGIAWSHRPGSRLAIRRVVVPALRDLMSARRHLRTEVRVTRAARTTPTADAENASPTPADHPETAPHRAHR
jgi:dolichyl-phosphate beta-glucosyltransferase